MLLQLVMNQKINIMKTTFLVEIIDNKLAPVAFDENHIKMPILITTLKPIRILERKSFMLRCNVNNNKLLIKFSFIISVHANSNIGNDFFKNEQSVITDKNGYLYEITEGEKIGYYLLCYEEINDNDAIEIQYLYLQQKK